MRKSRIATVSMVFVTIALLVLAPAGVGCSFTHDYDYCEDKEIYDLVIAQTIDDMGKITVSNYGPTLNIVIETWGGWMLVESHVDIGLSLDDIEQTGSGSPKPGKFTYSTPDESSSYYHWYQIDLTEDHAMGGMECGDTLYIAVHAVVKKKVGCEWSEQTAWGKGTKFDKSWGMWFTYDHRCCKSWPTIPDFAINMKFTHPYGNLGYWKVTVYDTATDGYDTSGYTLYGDPDGVDYIGWCVDKAHTMSATTYSITPIDTYDLPNQALWEKINWIINHKDGYTRDEIQDAMWYFTDGWTSFGSSNTWNLVNAAAAIHPGYHPGSGGWVAIYLETPQKNILELDP